MRRGLALLPILFGMLASPALAEPECRIEISSEALGETRAVHLYVPEHDEGDVLTLLVVTDGEDFGELAAAYVDHLEAMANAQPVLVAAIPNMDRHRDMLGNPAPFASFISDELLPKLASTYPLSGHEILFTFSSGTGLAETFLEGDAAAFDGYIVAGAGLGPRGLARWRSIAASDHPFIHFSTEGEPSPRAAPAAEILALEERQDHFLGRILEGQTHDSAGAIGLLEGLVALLPRKLDDGN